MVDDGFLSAEFIWRKILEGTAPAVPKLCGRAGARPSKPLPSKKPFAIFRSLFATRHSLLAAVLARQEPRPPNFSLKVNNFNPFWQGNVGIKK